MFIPAAYAAPKEVYTTARISLSREDNITWSLPVDFGFIRLHLYVQKSRNFVYENGMAVHVDVHTNSSSGATHAETSSLIQERGVPVYRDFIVNLSRKHHGDVFVSVSIQYNRSSVHNVPFLNGFEIFKLSDESNSLARSNPFKARKVSLSANHFIARIVYYILLTVVGVSIYSALISLQLPLPSSFKWKIRTVTCLPLSKDCPHFTLAEIESVTENFSAALLLGSGGLGKVYKGFVNNRNTLTAVAIKRSNPESRQGINEFQTEITILSKLRHCHLVSLIGCCMEANESILVYSFMARGALADHLYKTKESPLPWKKRRCSSRTALSPHVVRKAMYSKEMFGRQGSNRPSMGEILCNLELAWRQELKSSLMEANGTHGMTDVNFTPMIDGQQLFPAGNSEPTLGVELSVIIVPTGR
ncbi:hypothetical protein Golax_002837 [Gossypium laxum]|uniref:Protein kinase domain-containing protein n=1 Tax=Gossypium laxum TaxID=34288 RepID=A0A7J9ASJ8_9ROSI|nr:hypothetical protein [Gossypium laxum]